MLESRSYELIQGVLYFEPPTSPGNLCTVVPVGLHSKILQETHSGTFAGHLLSRKCTIVCVAITGGKECVLTFITFVEAALSVPVVRELENQFDPLYLQFR